ncbi:MAG: methyltransferase domain-containing protein [Terriglobales bacterium]
MKSLCDNTQIDILQEGIPPDEAVFYDAVAASEVEQLRALSSIAEVGTISSSVSFATLANIFAARDRGRFPDPKRLWLASAFECAAEYEAFKFLAPIEGKTVLQLGGKGTEAVRMMLAGAKSANLVSPVKSELECGHELGRLCGVAIESRVGLAERIPYADESFDVVYSSGSAHHFKTNEAFPEIRRVLKSKGRFAAIEPWRAPFYKLGIRVFGKREKDVHCRPLDRQRVSTFQRVFRVAEVRQSGTLLRYPMIAAGQMGLPISVGVAWRLMRADDFICTVLRLRSLGSCVAILAER